MTSGREFELTQLATLLAERNLVDGRIAQLIDRPVERGHIGEWIASRIFAIDLHPSAVHAASDGVLRLVPGLRPGDARRGRVEAEEIRDVQEAEREAHGCGDEASGRVVHELRR